MKKNKKKTRSADFCEDWIDVITNFAVITNAVIKRVYCTQYARQGSCRFQGRTACELQVI